MYKKSFKVALAVVLSISVGKLLNIESPFYAAIASVITIGTGFGDSLESAKNRMVGTFIGAIIGIIFATLDQGNIILCGIGIFITVLVCQRFNCSKSINIACIVFIAIMVNLYDYVTPFYYSIYRLADTLLGVTISTLINYVLFIHRGLKTDSDISLKG